MTPLAIDLFCGLGGWTEGLLAEGYFVVGFDIERHEYWMPEESLSNEDGGKGTNPVAKRGITQGCAVSLGLEGANAMPRTRFVSYPAQLVLQDVLTLHGRQFKDAALIVASPPCQEYSYMAMPWKLAKAKAAAIRADTTGESLVALNRLFNACFRIQAEASLAAGRHIPLVVENVRGAQPWVGRARWNFGSFYLWGDVPALMPMTSKRAVMKAGVAHRGEGVTNFHGQKVPGFRFDGSGRSSQSASVAEHFKVPSEQGRRTDPGKGAQFTSRDCGIEAAGKHDVDQETSTKIGGDWFSDPNSTSRRHGSKSKGRKMASAIIAKIPLILSRHIAATYRQ